MTGVSTTKYRQIPSENNPRPQIPFVCKDTTAKPWRGGGEKGVGSDIAAPPPTHPQGGLGVGHRMD